MDECGELRRGGTRCGTRCRSSRRDRTMSMICLFLNNYFFAAVVACSPALFFLLLSAARQEEDLGIAARQEALGFLIYFILCI